MSDLLSHQKEQIDATALVIFGATGDLATSKLFPALINLFTEERLPKQFEILGVSRKSFSDSEFRDYLREAVEQLDDLQARQRQDFLSNITFQSGDVTSSDTYNAVHKHLQVIDESADTCVNKLFYLALPPRFYTDVGTHFANSRLLSLCESPNAWLRILVEKPYGTDLQTAHKIDDALCKTFSSDQLFRIDHYLAKQSLQNVLTLRFRNQIFSGSWNRQYIDRIHVKMLEQNTINGRGSFYDKIGAFRDVGQNHLLQILAAATMEPPADENSNTIREARANLFEQLRPIDNTDAQIIRGQYEGYVSEDGVARDSQTETYFRIPARIENDRWNGVPIVLEGGKGLRENRVEIEVSYREPPSRLHSVEPIAGNTMILQFKPRRGVIFDVWTESPDLDTGLRHQNIDFSFSPKDTEPTAYAALLDQALRGEQVMFANNREVTASWEFTEAATELLSDQPLQTYTLGSAGPSV